MRNSTLSFVSYSTQLIQNKAHSFRAMKTHGSFAKHAQKKKSDHLHMFPIIWPQEKGMIEFNLECLKMNPSTIPHRFFFFPSLAVSALLCCGSGCLCPRCGCVPVLTCMRWVLSEVDEAEKSRYYYLAKLPCDGKVLSKEQSLNNWSSSPLNFAGTCCDFQHKVGGHLNKIFTSLFKNAYIREPLRCCRPAPLCCCPVSCHLSVSSIWNGFISATS